MSAPISDPASPTGEVVAPSKRVEARKRPWAWWIVSAVAALLTGALLLWEPGAPPKTASEDAGFTLESSEGAVSLSDFHGKVVLVYFGYASCPDICPTSLAYLGTALAQLDPAERAQAQGVFISVDPARDTPARLAEYGRFFHEEIIGLTGSEEEIAEVAARYGVIYRRIESDSAMGYSVDHSSVTYVVDREGRLVESLPHGTPSKTIADAIRRLLRS